MSMVRKVRRILFALPVVAALILLAGLFSFRGERQQQRAPVFSGFEDFTKANEAVSLDLERFYLLDRSNLRSLVLTNAEALRLLRAGLPRQDVMPADSILTYINKHPQMELQNLFNLFLAEGRLREMDNQYADAIKSYLDAIRFGGEMSRGGLSITRMLGIVFETTACNKLAKMAPKLEHKECIAVIGELEKIDAERFSWSEIVKNQKEYNRYTRRNLYDPFQLILMSRRSGEDLQRTESLHKTIVAFERLLSGELALRCYRTEHGHLPARLDDVVPGFLSRIPQDPFTGHPMVYCNQGTNWLLYSIGPNTGYQPTITSAKELSLGPDPLFYSRW